MPSDPAAAECREVVQVYQSASGPVHALREVSLTIGRSSLSVVVGPSGAGKSTLLRLLGGLERPTVGEVLIGGDRTAHLSGRARRRLVARRIGHVFQMPAQNLLDYLDVRAQVRLAWRMRDRMPGAVDDLVARVGLDDVADELPGELAAGQQQRLAFAMAVAGSPALVVADEPTASLDPEGARILIGLLDDLRERGEPGRLHPRSPAGGAGRSGAGHPQRRARGRRPARRHDAGRHRRLGAAGALRWSGRRPSRAGEPALSTTPTGSGWCVRRARSPPSGSSSATAVVTGVVTALDGVDIELLPGRPSAWSGRRCAARPRSSACSPGGSGSTPGRCDGRAASPEWSELAVIPQGFALVDEATVAENVLLSARCGGPPITPERLAEVGASIGIDHLLDRLVTEISVGSGSGRWPLERWSAARPLPPRRRAGRPSGRAQRGQHPRHVAGGSRRRSGVPRRLAQPRGARGDRRRDRRARSTSLALSARGC